MRVCVWSIVYNVLFRTSISLSLVLAHITLCLCIMVTSGGRRRRPRRPWWCFFMILMMVCTHKTLQFLATIYPVQTMTHVDRENVQGHRFSNAWNHILLWCVCVCAWFCACVVKFIRETFQSIHTTGTVPFHLHRHTLRCHPGTTGSYSYAQTLSRPFVLARKFNRMTEKKIGYFHKFVLSVEKSEPEESETTEYNVRGRNSQCGQVHGGRERQRIVCVHLPALSIHLLLLLQHDFQLQLRPAVETSWVKPYRSNSNIP